jgi:hypothetical protein
MKSQDVDFTQVKGRQQNSKRITLPTYYSKVTNAKYILAHNIVKRIDTALYIRPFVRTTIALYT